MGELISKCCKAPIDYGGGGYDGEDVCPVTQSCSECHQLLAINGSQFGVELRDPDTRRLLKAKYSKGKTILTPVAKSKAGGSDGS